MADNKDVYAAIIPGPILDSATDIRVASPDEMVYDPVKREWVAKYNPVPLPSNNNPTPESDPNNATQTDTQTEADKEYIDNEYNTLEGDLSHVPSDKLIKIKPGDTIRIKGIGRYLSGLYFVSSVKRTISSSDGYSQTLTVIKTGFGDSLKKAYPDETSSSERKEEVKKSAGDFKVGDKVKIVGDDAVYANASDGVKVPGWVKEQELTIDAISDDGTRARVNPIWSWTYTKYLKKV